MRARVVKIVFLMLFLLCFATPVLSSELLQIETPGVGLLALPLEWRVISRDEQVEQYNVSDWVLNVQQILYARTEYTPAALQIFSMWGTDLEGNAKPVPDDMLDTNGNSLVSGLIGQRYGDVLKLGDDAIETVLGNLSVITYGVERYFEDVGMVEFRYKRAFLYHNDKLVLVLLRYEPEFENYWHSQLTVILDEWVGTLALTPMRRPLMTMIPRLGAVSLPELPVIAQQEQYQPEEPDQEEYAAKTLPPPSLLLPVISLVSLLAALCIICVLFIGRRPQKTQRNKEQALNDPASVEAELIPVTTITHPGKAKKETEAAPEAGTQPPATKKLLSPAEEHLIFRRYGTNEEGFSKVRSLLNQAMGTLDSAESTEKTEEREEEEE